MRLLIPIVGHRAVEVDGLRCRSRIVGLAAFRVKRVHLLRRVFTDAVGLGLEQGGFPGLLLRLFLTRVSR